MSRIKRTMVACAAVASVAAFGAAPAQAQEENLEWNAANPCTQSLPDCTTWTFDTAREAIEDGRAAWNQTWAIPDRLVCDVYEFVTGQDCPDPARAIMQLGYLR